jgi:hypothetical protein
MIERSVVAIYDRMSDAEEAIHLFHQGGFPLDQISIVLRDFESEKHVHGLITTGDIAKSGSLLVHGSEACLEF